MCIRDRRETAQAVWQQIRDTHHSATLFQGTGLYDGEERVMPVSYTHLDVYKRQDHHRH